MGVFAASLWALLVTTTRVDTRRLAAVMPRLPRHGPAVLMVASGLVTMVIWVGPVLAAQLSRATPARLDGYTTLVTVALDIAVITPAALAAGALIWHRRPVGYRFAVPLLILETLLAPMIIAQTVSQFAAGIAFSPAELIAPLTGFAVLAVAAAAVLVTVLRVPPGGARPGWLGRLNHPVTRTFERILAGRVLQGRPARSKTDTVAAARPCAQLQRRLLSRYGDRVLVAPTLLRSKAVERSDMSGVRQLPLREGRGSA